MNGKGKVQYPDKSSYEGDFKEDMKDGQGTLVYPDGKKYIGGFQNDLMHGRGKLIVVKGGKPTETECLYEKGKRR